MRTIAVVGAGGFAREVAWLISDISDVQALGQTSDQFKFAGFLVSDASKLTSRDSELLGDFSWLKTHHVDALAMGIGSPEIRLRLATQLKRDFPDTEWPALIHPSVRFDSSCRFQEGVTISAGTIATVNVEIAAFAMVNLSCTIGHETTIGEGTVVNPLTAISGGVNLGKRVLVGTHTSILQYIEVGDDAVIGSGAMVNKNVEAGSTVMGVPAKQRERVMAAKA
jgi:sugar O-acyltransferase (sialic acid O-acetyltransferase NeuD family)